MAYVRMTKNEMESLGYERATIQDLRVKKISDNNYEVYNAEKGIIYNIEVKDEYVHNCNCPHHCYRRVVCKHMFVVAIDFKLKIENWGWVS